MMHTQNVKMPNGVRSEESNLARQMSLLISIYNHGS